jgi:hypothetical protein
MRYVARVVMLVAYEQFDRGFDEDSAQRMLAAIRDDLDARHDSPFEEVEVESVDSHYADAPTVVHEFGGYGDPIEREVELAIDWHERLVAPFLAEWEIDRDVVYW